MMKQAHDPSEQKGARTLLIALLLSLPGPIITLAAAISSGSAAQIADCIRRSAELVASLVSYCVFLKSRKRDMESMQRATLERTATRTVSMAMMCSGVALAAVGIARLISTAQSKASIMGLVIAVLGLVANVIFYIRYRGLVKAKHDAVLSAQMRLYRAKSFIDICIIIALLAALIAPSHRATMYIDGISSIVVAFYLVGSALLPNKGYAHKR